MSEASFEIGSTGERDLDDISRIEQASFPTGWRRALFAGELTAAGRYIRVARKESGELVGYLFAMYLFDEMHVNKIAVDPSHRRRGIALALMHECLAFARSQKVRSISLEVRERNSGALEFYRRLGFRPVYVRKRYYPDGEAAVVMTAEVGEG
ncbi:MAG TPA: ribosomal protein S18-alanine N-acetyltransferase [Thermoanaerobaculia bacterium]|nr:ribosomal protein S18-alanine N-acetyltransferase [Thermoanaerobaculia bacterium]